MVNLMLTAKECAEVLEKEKHRARKPRNGATCLKTPIRPAGLLSDGMAGYVAGFIDADGCLSGSMVYICNTDLDVLLLLQHFIGGHIGVQGSIVGGKRKQGYQLILRNLEQKALLPQIIPYMVIKKIKAIKRLQLLEIAIDGRSKERRRWLTTRETGV